MRSTECQSSIYYEYPMYISAHKIYINNTQETCMQSTRKIVSMSAVHYCSCPDPNFPRACPGFIIGAKSEGPKIEAEGQERGGVLQASSPPARGSAGVL